MEKYVAKNAKEIHAALDTMNYRLHPLPSGLRLRIQQRTSKLEGGNIGIVEKAQETRFGMSPKYSRYIWIAFLESCFVHVIVKSPSKPYIVVHLFSNVHHTVVHSILASLIIVTYVVANNSWCAV